MCPLPFQDKERFPRRENDAVLMRGINAVKPRWGLPVRSLIIPRQGVLSHPPRFVHPFGMHTACRGAVGSHLAPPVERLTVRYDVTGAESEPRCRQLSLAIVFTVTQGRTKMRSPRGPMSLAVQSPCIPKSLGPPV